MQNETTRVWVTSSLNLAMRLVRRLARSDAATGSVVCCGITTAMRRSPLLTFRFHREEFRIGLSRSCLQVTFSIPQDWQSTKPHLDSALIQPVNIQIDVDFIEQRVRSSSFTLRDFGRAHRTGPVVMLVQAPGYRIVRSPSACLNMRIFSSVVRRLPFIRLTPLAKVLRLTLFMDQFSEAQPKGLQITEAAFRNKVLKQLLHLGPLDEEFQESQQLRNTEVQNIVCLLNIFGRLLFEPASRASELSDRETTRAKRLSYQSSLQYVASLLRKLVGHRTAVESPRELLEKSPSSEQWKTIEEDIRRRMN